MVAVTMYRGHKGWSIIRCERLRPEFSNLYPKEGRIITTWYGTTEISFSIENEQVLNMTPENRFIYLEKIANTLISKELWRKEQ